ncbi:Uncharacterised protein [Serratia fonticola]|uniref:hypothetical protein n=1 Tax=Serratia fonticola TaxID=47917 RepID=UPI00218307A8|nr:hypothetical protein [Serratia fonticola]CAI2121036.1 Uncharacterised protein [Serratia fonticola]
MTALKYRGVFPSTLVYPKIEDFEIFKIMADAPVKTGLIGSYFVGKRNISPLYNFANPDLPLLQVGKPTFQREYAALSHAGYFDTQIKPTAKMSVITITRYPSAAKLANRVPIVSSYFKDPSGAISGDTMLWGANGFMAYAQAGASVVTSATKGVAYAEDEFCVVGQIISANPAVGAWVLGEVGAAYSSTPMGGRVTSNQTILIGSTHSDNEFLNDSSVSAVLIYNNDIGTTAMNATMLWLRDSVGVEAGIWKKG